MRKIGQMVLAAGAAAILAGCTPDYLATGCYQPTNPDDGCIACVYEDIIFLRVKLPENSNRPNQNSDWAGEYKLDKDSGEITLKMSNEVWRNWKFYFNIRQAGHTIKIDDYSRQKTYTLVPDNAAATQGDLQPMK